MTEFYLFSDASCNPLKKQSIGCYTLVTDMDKVDFNKIQIHTFLMNFSSSTLAELQTIKQALKYAHEQIENLDDPVVITLYTDCRNFIDLIEKRKYKDNLKNHVNYELYNELINLVSLDERS